jgi:nucleotide-binding universal stress UspA family protein
MPDLQTVVAALDLAERPVPLVECARVWARENAGGRLFAVAAVAPVPAGLEPVLFPLACVGDDREVLDAELVRHAVAQLREALGERVAPDALRAGVGESVDATLDLARHIGPDLFVVSGGAPRRGEPGQLGVMASGLARRATCPVLVVPPDARPSTPTCVAVALDLTPSAAPLLAATLALAAAFGARVVPIVVAPLADDSDHASLHGPRQGDPLGRARKEAARLFTGLVEAAQVAFPVARERERLLAPLEVVAGDPGPAFLAAAEAAGADAIVINRCRTPEGSGMRLGRVAEYVVRRSDVPVLVCPPVSPAPPA